MATDPRNVWRDAARYADLGFRFVVACAGGTFGGWWLDRRFEVVAGFPLLTLLGFFFGLTVAMVSLFRGVAAERPDRRREEDERS